MITRTKLWWKLFFSGNKRGIFAGLAAHFGQVSVGLSQGFSAILLPKLLEERLADDSEASWIAALGVVSNPLGALIAGLCAECFGRKTTVALATLPHTAAWLLIALSENLSMLYTGRFISGVGTGMANGLYLYVSEVAGPNQRAWLASCGPVLVSLGVLAVYTLGAVTTWQRTAAISVGPALLSLALTRLLPETPAWLMGKGRTEEARDALTWLRGDGPTADQEYQDLRDANAKREDKKDNSISSALCAANVCKPFAILIAFFALQQLSGIYIILFYAVNLLENIGVNVNEYTGSVCIGAIRLLASILGAGLANNFGRKALAFASGFGMAVSATGAALSFRLPLPPWIPLACIGAHVASSMIGFLTLPWVMTSELYPLRFRGSLGGLTTCIVQIFTFLAIKLYPDVSLAIGLESTMWIFAMASSTGAVFAITILPETRNRSLDEIERKFANRSKSEKKIEPSSLHDDVTPRPRNIELVGFSSISEKHPKITANTYAYDNFSFETSPECSKKNRSRMELENERNCRAVRMI